MTIEQLFRSQPAANAIVVCGRDGAPRILAGSEIFRGFDAARRKAPGRRKLLRGLVAFRREGKKK
jgi:hypothetical protein